VVGNNNPLAIYYYIDNVCTAMVNFHVPFGITQCHREVVVSNNCIIINLDVEMSLYNRTDRISFEKTCIHCPESFSPF